MQIKPRRSNWKLQTSSLVSMLPYNRGLEMYGRKVTLMFSEEQYKNLEKVLGTTRMSRKKLFSETLLILLDRLLLCDNPLIPQHELNKVFPVDRRPRKMSREEMLASFYDFLDSRLTPTYRNLMMLLVEGADEDFVYEYDDERIAKLYGKSLTTTKIYLQVLRDNGYLEILYIGKRPYIQVVIPSSF